MRIYGVIEIFDNDEFVTIVTKNSVIHLPIDGKHSIIIRPLEADSSIISVNIDLNQG